ncbi:MBL fold metallo-hydrolase [Alicyclobacillaceae bacterium I2511]|nr:MBL fold metallo-hydrolase [Alicyclobacillaceae bacterium I2511]
MQFSVLASGSSGNSLYLQEGNTQLLLDAGISGRQIQQRLLSAANTQIGELQALLLTHEHVDHVRGVQQILKQSQATIYTTEGTWRQVAVGLPANLAEKRVSFIRGGEPFTIGEIHITPFTVSHDAEEPVAYRFDTPQGSLAVVTDLGYVSDTIKQVIANCQCYVFESNHDVEMLRAGRYPWNVKRRIIGDKGHLSNTDAAIALADVLGNQGVDVYLAHLSAENNQPDLAELTVYSVLQEIQARFAEQVTLHRTSREQPGALHALTP